MVSMVDPHTSLLHNLDLSESPVNSSKAEGLPGGSVPEGRLRLSCRDEENGHAYCNRVDIRPSPVGGLQSPRPR